MNFELNSRDKYINKAERVEKFKLLRNDLHEKSVKSKKNHSPKFKYYSALDIADLKKSQIDKSSIKEGSHLFQTNSNNSNQFGTTNLKRPMSSLKNPKTIQERSSCNKIQTNEEGDLQPTNNSVTSNGMEKCKGPKKLKRLNADKDSSITNINSGTI